MGEAIAFLGHGTTVVTNLIIERRGAMTFGSGNIKALYEAKERELEGVS